MKKLIPILLIGGGAALVLSKKKKEKKEKKKEDQKPPVPEEKPAPLPEDPLPPPAPPKPAEPSLEGCASLLTSEDQHHAGTPFNKERHDDIRKYFKDRLDSGTVTDLDALALDYAFAAAPMCSWDLIEVGDLPSPEGVQTLTALQSLAAQVAGLGPDDPGPKDKWGCGSLWVYGASGYLKKYNVSPEGGLAAREYFRESFKAGNVTSVEVLVLDYLYTIEPDCPWDGIANFQATSWKGSEVLKSMLSIAYTVAAEFQ